MHPDKEFTLYTKVLKYDKYLRKYVTNAIPNVHRDLRIRLLDESYNVAKYLYQAEYTKGNIRLKNITDMLVSLSMMDFLTDEIMEVCKENKKHIETSIGMLTEIKNMTYRWRKNPEPNEKDNS